MIYTYIWLWRLLIAVSSNMSIFEKYSSKIIVTFVFDISEGNFPNIVASQVTKSESEMLS
jgi:hypothetical protein